jgi:F-type H+-transporting ATPase subunit epsilon
MKDNTFRVAAVSSGTLKVSKEGVVILATAVEWADEIDVEHAKRSEEDAREKIKIHKSGVEFDRAQLKLKRALNRLSVSKNG